MAEKSTLPRKVCLVDGSGFIFRAFYALPPLTRGDGTPVNAVLGYCNMIYKLARDQDCDAFVGAVRYRAHHLPQRKSMATTRRTVRRRPRS